MTEPRSPHVPFTSIIFGYGPMLPLIAGGIAAWVLPPFGSFLGVGVACIWGAAILVFLAGVRRGFGFERPEASEPVEIVTMLVYFSLGVVSLALGDLAWKLGLLLVGYLLVAVLDRRAAAAGDAPLHFARLRPPQMLLGAAGIAAALARVLTPG